MPHTQSLLAVFAHPDDEFFGPGGTLARYAATGVEVWLVCGTDGDAGTVDAEMLADVASTVATARGRAVLRGPDAGPARRGLAGLPRQRHGRQRRQPSTPASLFKRPMDEVVGKIVALHAHPPPQVVICDNQFGGYGHPDHIKLHRATVKAFEVAGDAAHYPEAGPPWQPQRLYFTAFAPGLLKLLVRVMPLFRKDPRRFGRNHDIDLVQIVSWETPIHARVDVRPYLAVKDAASACHKSQGGDQNCFKWIPQFIQRRYWGSETFTRGVPAPRARRGGGARFVRGCG